MGEFFYFILTVSAVRDVAVKMRTNPDADRRSSEGRWVARSPVRPSLALSLSLSFAFSALLALGTRPSVHPPTLFFHIRMPNCGLLRCLGADEDNSFSSTFVNRSKFNLLKMFANHFTRRKGGATHYATGVYLSGLIYQEFISSLETTFSKEPIASREEAGLSVGHCIGACQVATSVSPTA